MQGRGGWGRERPNHAGDLRTRGAQVAGMARRRRASGVAGAAAALRLGRRGAGGGRDALGLGLEAADGLGREALVAFDLFVLDLLAVLEGTEAVPLDAAEVHEDVPARVIEQEA